MAACFAFAGSGIDPARADCATTSATTINCAPPGTGGFVNAGATGQTLTVQPDASVIAGGNSAIRLGNINTIINNGTVQATGAATNGLRAGTDSSVINNGSIIVINGAGIDLGNNTAVPATPNVINTGTITVLGNGAGIAVGLNHNVLNTGTITGGFGIVGMAGTVVNNYGTIASGPGGEGVQLVDANHVLNNYGLISTTSSGLAIDICGCATNTTVNNYGRLDGGINVDGQGNTFANAGLLTITDPATPIGPGFFGPNFAVWNQSFTPGFNTYIQTSAGIFAPRVDNLGNSDLLIADKFQLAGTLQIAIQKQLYQPQTFSGPVLEASFFGAGCCSPIDSTFQRFVASSPFFTVIPIYDTGDPTGYFALNVELDRIPFGSVPGSTRNQMAVGGALEPGYSPNLDPTSVAGQFYANLLSATSIGVLDNLSGEGTAALQNASLGAGSQFNYAALNQLLFGDVSGTTSVIIHRRNTPQHPSRAGPTPSPRCSRRRPLPPHRPAAGASGRQALAATARSTAMPLRSAAPIRRSATTAARSASITRPPPTCWWASPRAAAKPMFRCRTGLPLET